MSQTHPMWEMCEWSLSWNIAGEPFSDDPCIYYTGVHLACFMIEMLNTFRHEAFRCHFYASLYIFVDTLVTGPLGHSWFRSCGMLKSILHRSGWWEGLLSIMKQKSIKHWWYQLSKIGLTLVSDWTVLPHLGCSSCTLTSQIFIHKGSVGKQNIFKA